MPAVPSPAGPLEGNETFQQLAGGRNLLLLVRYFPTLGSADLFEPVTIMLFGTPVDGAEMPPVKQNHMQITIISQGVNVFGTKNAPQRFFRLCFFAVMKEQSGSSPPTTLVKWASTRKKAESGWLLDSFDSSMPTARNTGRGKQSAVMNRLFSNSVTPRQTGTGKSQAGAKILAAAANAQAAPEYGRPSRSACPIFEVWAEPRTRLQAVDNLGERRRPCPKSII